MIDDVSYNAPPCIVLIEDDPLVRFGQEMLLKDWGYRVVSGTSRDAIRLALGETSVEIAAIIADFNVGGPDSGAEIARGISESARRQIPTVIMSASLGRTSGEAANLHGYEFLSKPVEPERLRDWLATAVAKHSD